MRLFEQLKQKSLRLLSNAEEAISGSNERTRALETLGLTQYDLDECMRIQQMGSTAYSLRQLGITQQDLEQLKNKQSEPKTTREKIQKLVPEASSFRKFITWTYAEYDEYKKRFRSEWKHKDERHFVKQIRRLANGNLSRKDIFQLVLYCFFLSTKR